MATWTPIPNSSLEPGAPARSFDALALRDNPIAIAEGQSGAPRIDHTALKTDTGMRDWVLARTAAASVGSVGTYAMRAEAQSIWSAGSTTSGSTVGPGLSGTWMAMQDSQKAGAESFADGSKNIFSAGIYLRIS